MSLDPPEVLNADEEPEERKRRKSDETEDMDQTEVATADFAAAQEARRSAQASVVRPRDPAAEAIRKRSEERRQRYRQSDEEPLVTPGPEEPQGPESSCHQPQPELEAAAEPLEARVEELAERLTNTEIRATVLRYGLAEAQVALDHVQPDLQEGLAAVEAQEAAAREELRGALSGVVTGVTSPKMIGP